MPSNLVQTFRPENIPIAISYFQPDSEVPVLDKEYMDGGQCRIFKVDFSDGQSWSIRIPIHNESNSQDDVIKALRREQYIFREIGGTGFSWAPKYYGSSFTFENLVGFPFVILSWIEGSSLRWTDSYPSRPVRDKILSQLAEIHMSLIECTREFKGTTTEFFSSIIDNKIRRVRNGHLSEITEQDCFDQRSLLTSVLYPELENTPFAIDHGDLSPSNIIVDSDHNIRGIIDWGFASKAPIHLAGRFPRILQLQEYLMPPSQTLHGDRKAYVASLMSQSSEVASWMLLMFLSDDVDFRHCFLESIISKGMHRSLANLGWKLPWTVNNSDH